VASKFSMPWPMSGGTSRSRRKRFSLMAGGMDFGISARVCATRENCRGDSSPVGELFVRSSLLSKSEGNLPGSRHASTRAADS
jgi:hypothetical protein